MILETIKLFDSELKVMEVIWQKEPITAKDVSILLQGSIGWNKNTTYTILKKLVDKKIIMRGEPDFVCTSLVKKSEVQSAETNNLIEKFYNGSKKMFFATFLQNEKLSKEEVEFLKGLIDKNDQ